MPQTTTLRLAPEFRERVAQAAARQGLTPHAFMIEAITESLNAAELRASFHEDADAGLRDLLESGTGLLWEEVRPWLEARAEGQEIAPPVPRSWR